MARGNDNSHDGFKLPDSRRWQWANIPIPKSHIVGLIAGCVLQQLESRQLPVSRRTALIFGTCAIGLNVLIIGWAGLTLGRVDSRNPERIDGTLSGEMVFDDTETDSGTNLHVHGDFTSKPAGCCFSAPFCPSSNAT